MTFLNNAGLTQTAPDMHSLFGDGNPLVAVSLTNEFKLCTFVNENNLDEMCKEELITPKGLEIYVRSGVALPGRLVLFPDAVGRAVAEILHEWVEEMRSEWVEEMQTDPRQPVFEGREQPNGMKTLPARELEVERAIAKTDSFREKSHQMVLAATLLNDGMVRLAFKKDEFREKLEGRLFSRALLFGDCCPELCGGRCAACECCRMSEGFSKLVAWILSIKSQQHLCCLGRAGYGA